ncbi:putative ankyrin repeat protein-like protein [Leptotrombidium deliense]|uniref:Putative ankyrin repeat protein-like protein n=1 Tax=Leptotrombidium deliense TaxID=299467 RepID=A0A443SUX2_9ACAR|nr:putative ankyrin repeat protein-like protein [Leptotrombidium deliense]
MGATISSFFQRNCGHFLSNGISDATRHAMLLVMQQLRHMSPSDVNWSLIEMHLARCPRNENILAVTESDGYNVLQWAVGLQWLELVRWILNYGVDVNRGPCSLPLHIAAVTGNLEIAELLIKHGAKVEQEVRICFPGSHSNSCELRRPGIMCNNTSNCLLMISSCDRSQNAQYYAIDGDKAEMLDFLTENSEENWLPWQPKKPLLYVAFERRAWNCVKCLLPARQEEINQCYEEEYYPIHQAVLHDIKFVELLLQCNVDITARTATQQLTVIHVLLLLGKKSATDTTATLKLLFEHGAKELINKPDSLGNTPLHALIVRYALEEARYGFSDNEQCVPWTTWDMLHLLRYMLQQGAAPSINKKGNGALACVLRHVRDWEFRFELLNMLLQHGGDPNCVGRDGSVPLIVCLVPLLNKGLLHLLNHTKKVSYLNCVRLLCKYGANPNCSWRTNLTPLHVLVFTAGEYITLMNRVDAEDKETAFAFIRQVLTILLQHKLDPNVSFSQRKQHILLALLDMVQNARNPRDLDYVHDLTVTLLQYGANANVLINNDEHICQSQSSMFLKKSSNYVVEFYVQYLIDKQDVLINNDSEQHFAKLLLLYYNTMKHSHLYACLKELNKLERSSSVSSDLSNLLKSMASKPRSLKSMARNCVYYALGGQLMPNINKLQLPGPLREYVLEFLP